MVVKTHQAAALPQPSRRGSQSPTSALWSHWYYIWLLFQYIHNDCEILRTRVLWEPHGFPSIKDVDIGTILQTLRAWWSGRLSLREPESAPTQGFFVLAIVSLIPHWMGTSECRQLYTFSTLSPAQFLFGPLSLPRCKSTSNYPTADTYMCMPHTQKDMIRKHSTPRQLCFFVSRPSKRSQPCTVLQSFQSVSSCGSVLKSFSRFPLIWQPLRRWRDWPWVPRLYRFLFPTEFDQVVPNVIV